MCIVGLFLLNLTCCRDIHTLSPPLLLQVAAARQSCGSRCLGAGAPLGGCADWTASQVHRLHQGSGRETSLRGGHEGRPLCTGVPNHSVGPFSEPFLCIYVSLGVFVCGFLKLIFTSNNRLSLSPVVAGGGEGGVAGEKGGKGGRVPERQDSRQCPGCPETHVQETLQPYSAQRQLPLPLHHHDAGGWGLVCMLGRSLSLLTAASSWASARTEDTVYM